MIALAIRAPYAFWIAMSELNLFSSLRVRKAMSTVPDYFRYVIGNDLSEYVKNCKGTAHPSMAGLDGWPRWLASMAGPPVRSRMLLSAAPALEPIGQRWFAGIAGVIVAEAVKEIYAGNFAFSPAERKAYASVVRR